MQLLDIVVIAVYMSGIVWAGIRSRSKKKDADSFFTAKGAFTGRLGMILVGLSMVATLFSGISFVVYTSSAYSDGAAIILGAVTLPIAWLVLRFWFLPRYLAGDDSHPYDIIERRLGAEVRLCVSAMFILLRLGWMAVMLVAPTLILMGAAGLGPAWFWPIVAITGLVCTLYTSIGGIRGVIVTDAIQFVVMVSGIVFIIGAILWKIGVPGGEIITQLADSGHLRIFDFSFNPYDSFTFWGLMIGLSVANLGSYMGDLMMLQRYMASGSPRVAARAFAVNVWGGVILIVTLVVVGLLLWAWYQNHHDPGLPGQADQVLAYFIARELPAGLSGLLIASILAATMSSMTSGIIALASTLTNDWIKRFGRPRSEAELLRFGRCASIGIGVLAVLAAGFASKLGTMFEISQAVLGVFLGPMCGCMIVVVSNWTVRPGMALTGLALGTCAGWMITFSPIAVIWVAPASTAVTLLVSLMFRPQPDVRVAVSTVK